MFDWNEKKSLIDEVKDLIARVENADDKGRWVTIKGTHVFIPEGKEVDEVVKEKFGEKGESKDITKEEHEKIKEDVSKLSDDELVKAHFKAQKGYESETSKAGSLSKSEATYGVIAQELKKRTGRGFTPASSEEEIREALAKSTSETKGGKKYQDIIDKYDKKYDVYNNDKGESWYDRASIAEIKTDLKQHEHLLKYNEQEIERVSKIVSGELLDGEYKNNEHFKNLLKSSKKSLEWHKEHIEYAKAHLGKKTHKSENSLEETLCEVLAEALTEE